MNGKNFLKDLNFSLDENEKKILVEKTKLVVGLLKDEIKRQSVDAEVFLGGSFAKGTLIKSDRYDVDVFIRFDWEYENLTKPLLKIVKALSKKMKLKFEQIHGSRDYFRIKEGNLVFEIVPVTKISKPKEARNVTDLSYFHVGYLKRKLNDKLRREMVLAKAFCKAQEVYGAESYIKGFSGYALECLIIQYKTFERMLKNLTKEERIIIDTEKFYKNKEEILLTMNESRLQSPMIVVDPTWKERNVTAALSNETFEKFKLAAKAYLKNPSKKFFELKNFNSKKFKADAENGGEYVYLRLETNKQEGDIAGTKLKKFSNFLIRQISRYFVMRDSRFEYLGGQSANLYLSLKSKERLELIGPPIKMESATKAFKKKHKNTFEKNGNVYALENINFSAKQFIDKFYINKKDMIKSMDIVEIKFNST